MKNVSSERNFLDIMNFLYIFGKFFGLSCYSLSKGRIKYKVSFEITDFLQLIAFVAVYLTLIYYNLRDNLSLTNDPKNAIIFESIQQMLVMVSLLFLLGGIIQIVAMRQRFWEIANTLNGIDKEVGTFITKFQ